MKTIEKTASISAGIFIILAFASCQSRVSEEKGMPSVKIDTIRTAYDQTRLQYPGKVVASQDLGLSFKVSGTISRIYVKEGARVRAGQILALMDTTDYSVQLSATEAEYTQIKGDADRTVSLYNQNVTTKQNYDKAVYGLKQIQAKYDNHRNQLSYCWLRAPINGTIQKTDFGEGENVSAGMPVISMIGSEAPEVVINLSAADYIRRSDFQDYECSFAVFPGKTFALKPENISPKANANQLYEFRLQIQPSQGVVPTPGMNTTVSISCAGNAATSLKVTSGAIFKDGDNEYVYVVQDSALCRKQVHSVRLLSDGSSLVLSDEISENDAVVASGTHYLKDGEKVKPLKETSETNIGGLL